LRYDELILGTGKLVSLKIRGNTTNPPAENELVNSGVPAVPASTAIVNIQDVENFHGNSKTLNAVSVFLSLEASDLPWQG
jgi:hypothetical protein